MRTRERLRRNAVPALRSVRRARQRTGLAVAGIAVGVGAVLTMLSVGRMAREQALGQLRGINADVLALRLQIPTEGPGASAGLRAEDIVGLPGACRHVTAAVPLLQPRVDVTSGGVPLDGVVTGIDPSFGLVERVGMREGRRLSSWDRRAAFCVVGGRVAAQLAQMSNAPIVGRRLWLAGASVTIAGVLKPGPSVGPLRTNDGIFVPIAYLRSLLPATATTTLLARLRPGASAEATFGEILAALRRRGYEFPAEATSAEQILEGTARDLRALSLLLSVIGSISLIGGGAGVMNAMLASARERRGEIGVRRALGAHRADVTVQFLLESQVIALVGGLLGLLLGVLGTIAIARATGWPFIVSWGGVVLSLVVAHGVGALFGTYPALQAARTEPAVALRSA